MTYDERDLLNNLVDSIEKGEETFNLNELIQAFRIIMQDAIDRSRE